MGLQERRAEPDPAVLARQTFIFSPQAPTPSGNASLFQVSAETPYSLLFLFTP